jgi:murein DD-endopeptidase MepM/ murein hydrolase activator NlpD
VVVVQPEVQAAPVAAPAIAPPESLPPEASPGFNTAAPAAESAPVPVQATETASPSGTEPAVPTSSKKQTAEPDAAATEPAEPRQAEPRQAEPQQAGASDTIAPAAKPESALAERQRLIQQRLSELVAKDKPLKEEQLRQNLIAAVLEYARTGQFDQARQLAQDPILSGDEQADLLSQIDALQADADKLPNADGKKPGTTARRVSPGKDRPLRPNGSTVLLPAPVEDGAATVYPSASIYQGTLPPRITIPWRGGNVNLAFPLTMNAPITSGYGWRVHPIHGSPRFHRGIDIGAPIGTPVIATHAGTVETANFLSGYGLTIILKYKNGTQATLYAHLSEVFVKPGDQVKQGDIIGLVGNTGLSTGPHLHFEVQQLTADGWVAIDPMGPLQQGIAIAAGTPLTVNLSDLKAGSNFTLGIAPGFGLTGTYATRELLNQNLFPGLLHPELGDKMNLLVPLAIATPIAPELGWIAYPWMRELTPWQPYGTEPQIEGAG